MDKIYLNKLQFYGYHGVMPEENKLGQRFTVDLILELDLTKAGQSDDLNETVNYAEVYQIVKSIVEGKPSKLIEHLAEQLAAALLKSFSKIDFCTVKITKPDPPIPGCYESVAVEIRRGR
ncbi:dihydroneopterin aldolase [Calidifontibacillus erzurumensis]|uniref:dihydroneopterin aldolase n=1 Tax=Calidifontibacillus erzurumensis TaxID=2741433 RepID=UPI0035B53784